MVRNIRTVFPEAQAQVLMVKEGKGLCWGPGNVLDLASGLRFRGVYAFSKFCECTHHICSPHLSKFYI